MPDEEVELVRNLRGGDQPAMGKLYAMYRPRLLRMVNFRMDNRLKRRVDTDDILQEAWLAIAQRLPHFLKQPEDASCYVWMRLVTGQVIMDVYRRHLGTQARDVGREFSIHRFGNGQATSISIANFFVAQNTSPSQSLAREESIAEIRRVVEQMDPTDQEVLALRHFEELSNSEVAEVLNIAATAASTRYIRALKKLQQAMRFHSDLA